jgi:hypothetical protein
MLKENSSSGEQVIKPNTELETKPPTISNILIVKRMPSSGILLRAALL